MSPSPQSPHYTDAQYTDAQYADSQYADSQHAGPQYGDSRYAEPLHAGPPYVAAPPTDGQPRRRVGVSLGIVFSLLLVAAGALWLASVLVQQDETRSTTIAEPFSSVVIDSGSGDVHVQAAAASGARVEQRLRWSFSEPEVTTAVRDGVLLISADCTSLDLGLGCTVTLVIDVPARTPVRVETGSGDVDVWGMTAAVDLQTGAGDIAVVDVDGPVQTQTGSGDVSLTGVTATAISAQAGSGDVEMALDAAPGQLTVRTGSGDVRLWLPPDDAAYAVDVDTGSGDRRVDVRTDPGSARVLLARAGSGDVSIAYR